MACEKNINISVIVPANNVEQNIGACIDSLLKQNDLQIEIIVVNYCSTDLSGIIAEEYCKKSKKVKVIHREEGGLSEACNAGLALSCGDYIAFVNGNDCIGDNSLNDLYQTAIAHQADVLWGNISYYSQAENGENSFRTIPEEYLHSIMCGKEAYIVLNKSGVYSPMIWNYIFRREYIELIQIRFEEGILYENELWMPFILCHASILIFTDIDYYYNRQKEPSIIETKNWRKRLHSLFHITGRLMEFAGQLHFSGEEGELKSWFYVNIFRLYSIAFNLLPLLKDTSFLLPEHHLERFWRDSWEMKPEPQKVCINYFRMAINGFQKYINWSISEWVASKGWAAKNGNRVMLLYNIIWGEELSLRPEEVPSGWVITTDRRYLHQADVVVFHLPDLISELEYELLRQKGQTWVAWYLESEKNFPWIKSSENTELFDLWMSYRQNADIVHPYYKFEYINLLSSQVFMANKKKKTCMFVSSPLNESGRQEYLMELMKYTEIDSYGKLYNNRRLHVDNGREAKLDAYRDYKFVIAFENSIDIDYVTEKFFDPLLAGSVPVYLGAPNINDFAPGDNCFVDVRHFKNPQSLAQFINDCCEDEILYSKFFEWKKYPLAQVFTQKAELQKEHPLVQLCQKLDEN